MSDYSAVAPPPQQNFNQSSAFAAALQRAKQVSIPPVNNKAIGFRHQANVFILQIAAKINPGSTNPADNRQKRPLEDGPGLWG